MERQSRSLVRQRQTPNHEATHDLATELGPGKHQKPPPRPSPLAKRFDFGIGPRHASKTPTPTLPTRQAV